MKKFISCFTITLILTASFITGYVKTGPFVYADNTPGDHWTDLNTDNEYALAFQAYCASRDLTITGSAADAVTTLTTATFNGLCNTIGLDLTAIQGEIKKSTDGNLGLQYYFTTSGISAYNRLFAQFLQDNNLEVGDSANEQDNTLYSGEYITDDEGNSCLVYYLNTRNFSRNDRNYILKYGTPLKYTTEDLKSLSTATYKIFGATYNVSIYTNNTDWSFNNNDLSYAINNNGYFIFRHREGNVTSSNVFAKTNINGHVSVAKVGSQYYLEKVCYGSIYTRHLSTNAENTYNVSACTYINSNSITSPSNVTPVTIYLTTNNTVINNNNYEGDTIINNNGTPSEPIIPGPDLPDADDEWDIELPNLDINWILAGKENKFPFDIPFNLMFALSLLNAEPEAPHFEGTVDFKVYQWNYFIDLSAFNNVASVMRNLEFLAFLVGLMLMTRKLIWG